MTKKKNQQKKICVTIIFGGKSAEHEVSIWSARNIVKAINRKKYNVLLIGISRGGEWFSFSEEELLLEKPLFTKERIANNNIVIPCIKGGDFYIKRGENHKKVDIVFPVLHGPFGEDGTIQGLLKFFNIPYVGAGVLGSAVGMDKDVSKRLLQEAGISVVKFLVYKRHQKNIISFEKVKKILGLPFFVKPANLGSSVGISKVRNKKEFIIAIKSAFSYDNKIIIEKFIKGKEVECSVLGNENPIVSIPGEIIPHHEFYSYKAKYLDKNGAKLLIPADLSTTVIKKIQKTALKTYETLCCEGMGRVDFFATRDNRIYVSEINTIPGFTSISMYPKLWEYSNISYDKLIDRLIRLALDRHNTENKLKIT